MYPSKLFFFLFFLFLTILHCVPFIKRELAYTFSISRHYLVLDLGTTVEVTATGEQPSKIILYQGGSQIQVKDVMNKKVSFDIENTGTYDLKYLVSDQTSEIAIEEISVFEDIKSEISFRSPPTCCYKDKTHQLSLSKVDTASINVDLSTIKASVIREESNGSITAKDIARTDNNFIISQTMLESLDIGLYNLVIVEGSGYKQPLYKQDLQFSKLPLDDSYYENQFILNMTCIYPNLKIEQFGNEATRVALSCKFLSGSTTRANCTFPSTLELGDVTIYVGDTQIGNVTIEAANSKFLDINHILMFLVLLLF